MKTISRKILSGAAATAMLVSLALPAFAEGRSVAILGDSYSTFEGYLTPDTNAVWYFANPDTSRTDVSRVEETWWHRFITDNGLTLLQNNSFSGATICYTGYRKEDYTNRSFVNRSNYLPDADMILVFGGTNDDWARSPLGEYSFGEKTEQELRCVRPAVDEMLANLKRLHPKAEIIMIVNNELSPEVTEALLSLSERHGVPALMLRDIDKKHKHPTVKGMRQIADQLTEFLNTGSR